MSSLHLQKGKGGEREGRRKRGKENKDDNGPGEELSIYRQFSDHSAFLRRKYYIQSFQTLVQYRREGRI